ncbi:N-acetylmuramoyl-L-alanine amidase [Alkalihalobacillus sp. BA299]|uniref:peptidoglycan recognition protein family protein n=1 Tax=Alkalihalobacillus sp. BA299 TaxID=2815938 RepID=UPI001ADAEF3F|nr:N-acetylmuramoyl-L-alanine amidase [Alkalihalobacillus sp. BA299]
MQIIDARSLVPKDKKGRELRKRTKKIKRIVIHHGATKQGLDGTNYLSYLSFHINNLGWSTGGYTFGINDDGSILQGYDIDVITNHVGNYNGDSLGIVLAGDFRVEEPTPEQWNALYWLLNHLKSLLGDVEIVGHSEVPGYSWKPCPSLDMNQIRRNAANYSEKEIKIEVPKQIGGVQTMSLLKRGDKSPDVKTLQENLNTLGHQSGTPDGIFGAKTEAAVKSFQRASNLTVDGIAGPQTLGKIDALLKQKNKVTAPKKESATFTLGGRKYTIQEV